MHNTVSVYTLPKMAQSSFRYDNHELNYFARLEMPAGLIYDLNNLDLSFRKILAEHAIGYIDGGSLAYKYDDGSYAIMFEDDNFDCFWCHVPKDTAIVVDEQTMCVAGSGLTLEEGKTTWPPIWNFVEL